ncbi:MAG: hypothetical protein L3J71_15870 [Victivallaceae bacterium]|nr:hypothetical protein [Victivallaceae bacterium]
MPKNRIEYDCDTFNYWCSETDYNNRDKTFGRFVDDGRGYRIEDPSTPRPWLNYFSNAKFGSVISNRGLGFTWYKSTLLRITKYDHPIDYLPRDFQDGREIIVTDLTNGEQVNVLRSADNLICTHYPGHSIISATVMGIEFEFTLFVPIDDPCEIWQLKISNPTNNERELKVSFQQTWTLSRFGIHTAEEGIPYISTPGERLTVNSEAQGCYCSTDNPDLPYAMYGFFQSPQAVKSKIRPLNEIRPDGREFVFQHCELKSDIIKLTDETVIFNLVAGVETEATAADQLKTKYATATIFNDEFNKIQQKWDNTVNSPACKIPDKPLQYFLNFWFKNQLELVFNFVRSGQKGYRDTIQDAWGETMLDTATSTERLVEILSHQYSDGTAPRQYSCFNDGEHDTRRFMDSPVWLARTLIDLVKESGDLTLLEQQVPFLDSGTASIDEHVWRALDYLYRNRGQHGMCLTGDGDWNDALEGISKDGDAVSVWLTIAMYDAINLMVELYDYCGNDKRAAILKQRAAEIKDLVNRNAWDGEWYYYGFTGTGKPIGSKENKEGRIHLNAQTWAIFAGIADKKRAATALKAVDKILGTELGPMLLAPPYVDEGDEVGRIANLEPGTFENGSIYQHAVAFYIYACIANGNSKKAYQTMINLLPTNPENFDCRRSSEPYCTGNYYCGANHPRLGQNFFTWFTGNAAWLIRIGFDLMLGVKTGFNGLEINPQVPEAWDNYSVTRNYRGCIYNISFTRQANDNSLRLVVDGKELTGNIIPISNNRECQVQCWF